jgi:hypothetical protein
MVLSSKKFVAASIQHCKWLPCPSAPSTSNDGSRETEDLPAILAGWSEDAKVCAAALPLLGPLSSRTMQQ